MARPNLIAKIYKNVHRDMLEAMARLPSRDSQSRRWVAFNLGQGEADGDADFVSSRTSEERIARVMKAVDLTSTAANERHFKLVVRYAAG
jgi:hypothetical protein